jgi:hypothetical protein
MRHVMNIRMTVPALFVLALGSGSAAAVQPVGTVPPYERPFEETRQPPKFSGMVADFGANLYRRLPVQVVVNEGRSTEDLARELALFTDLARRARASYAP